MKKNRYIIINKISVQKKNDIIIAVNKKNIDHANMDNKKRIMKTINKKKTPATPLPPFARYTRR